MGPPQDLERAWPELLTLADPWAGDERIEDPADDSEQDARFREAYAAVLDGRAPWEAARLAARALGVDGPLRHDPRPFGPALAVVDDALLALALEDVVPDAGLVAPDRVLGPFADEPLPRWLRRLAGAVLSLSPVLWPKVRPVARAERNKGMFTPEQVTALRALRMAPPMLWRGEGPLRPALPLAPGARPSGLRAASPALVARAVPGPDGWWLAAVLPLPRLPDPAVVERRLLLEYQRLRRHEPRLTWEDLLRDRGEVLYRTVCEWCWLDAPEETLRCWTSGPWGRGEAAAAPTPRGEGSGPP